MPQPPPDLARVDRPWLVAWPPGVPETWSYPHVPVHRLVRDAARDAPDVVAARDATHAVTWSRLAGLVDEVARVLVGLGPDRVVVSCRRGIDVLVFSLATWRIGAVLELVDPTVGRRDTVPEDLPTNPTSEPASGGADLGDVAGPVREGEVVAPAGPPPPGTSRDDGADEVVVRVVDPRDRSDRGPAATVVVADTARLVDEAGRPGLVRRVLRALRRPSTSGDRVRLSALASTGGQASLPAVDPDRVALRLTTPDGPVEATQAQLVAAAFQVRLWIPDMATGTEVVASARPWWRPGGLVVGPLLAALSAGTVQLADAGVLSSTVSGATVAFADTATWEDLVPSGRWRRALGRGRESGSPLTSLRVAGVVVDGGAELVDDGHVERIGRATEGARVRHAWMVDRSVGPVLAQPLYGRLPGEPGCLPLPDTVLARHDGVLWWTGPQVAHSARGTDGWVRVADGGLPVVDLVAPVSVPLPPAASSTTSVRPEAPAPAEVPAPAPVDEDPGPTPDRDADHGPPDLDAPDRDAPDLDPEPGA